MFLSVYMVYERIQIRELLACDHRARHPRLIAIISARTHLSGDNIAGLSLYR